MAKGQVRSTREKRKPKKTAAQKSETTPTAASPFSKGQAGSKKSGGKS